MLCEKFETCTFFKTYKGWLSRSDYDLLVSSYCEGALQSRCKRLKYLHEHGEEPPADLRPDGYQIDSFKKIYS